MAETERTFAELQTLLQDNTARGISPQDLRDFMVSALGGYTSLLVEGNATPQALTSTPAKIDAFDTVGPELGPTASHAADQITINVDGVYRVSLLAVAAPAGAASLTFELFSQGAKVNGFTCGPIALGVGVDGVFAFQGHVSLSKNDVIDVRSSISVDGNATIRHAHLAIKRVG